MTKIPNPRAGADAGLKLVFQVQYHQPGTAQHDRLCHGEVPTPVLSKL